MSDVLVLTGRHLRLMSRRPASIVGAVVLPLLFAVLFFTVFGKVMDRAGIDYLSYLLPAVIIQAMFFTAMSSALLATEDSLSGTLQRLATMPVPRSAPVLGLLGAESTRALISTAVLIPVALIAGFRFEGTVLASVGFVLLTLGLAVALCTCFIALGLFLRSTGAVQVATNLIYFPFLLLSNAFAPTSAYPGWLQDVVGQQPISRVADALRALSSAHDGLAEPVGIALAWLAALTVAGAVAATRALGRHR